MAEYIHVKFNIPTEYVSEIPWGSLFDGGEIRDPVVMWFTLRAQSDLPESSMEILAVPVPAGKRYGARPVYFSDVVVRTSSRFPSFDRMSISCA